MIRVSVLGASGYVGGEALRLLLGHPETELVGATSSRRAGRRVDGTHPNLRGLTDLTFVEPDAVPECDAVFLATPHKQTMALVPGLLGKTKQVIDLSADFRLRDTGVYQRYYGLEHQAPDLLDAFVPGFPEFHREELRTADLISVPGCMAAAAVLALRPVAEAGLLAEGEPVDVDGRTGSSGSGASAGPENLHAQRSGVMRVFAPTGHRHEAEIAQAIGRPARMTATGVEAVRGVQTLCKVRLADGVDESALRRAYRRAYAAEPFVRIVAAKRGAYRLPEPKILSGSNFCDVGFAVGDDGRALLVGALDNLVKGSAGNGVQCLNIRYGWPETTGLEFPGLHPC
ncbi:N-acetyl-gamma-glutamyl-phosphate reductase [Kitasatospora sp. NPDC057223]|uniref:N-acetyl-gamma-glutamyl-phosphate reductase n=1 Tax=Kitasatospora sp. NPDC057223 TaxID=3346055 RepID=UPI00363241DE